jgi:hypothetical protein
LHDRKVRFARTGAASPLASIAKIEIVFDAFVT